MKKYFLTVAIGFVFSLFLVSCGNKEKKASDNPSPADETKQAPTENTTSTNTANEPKSFAVSFSPDTLYLGKNKEAFIRLKNPKAIELADADGKLTGIEFSYEIELTNKNKLGGNSVFVNPNDFRLQLDNNNNITHETYNAVTAAPESTSSTTDNKFRLPAGTRPKALNLFFDETRVSVTVDMK